MWSFYSSRIFYTDRESDDTPYLSIRGNGVHGQAIMIPVKNSMIGEFLTKMIAIFSDLSL